MPRLNRGRAALAAALLVAVALTIVVATAPGKPQPSRGQIAFRRFLDVERTTGAIFLINPNGRGDHRLTQPLPGGVDDQPNWAPDGSKIVFNRQPAGDNGSEAEFWTVKPDGSHARLLSPGCPDGPPTCLENEQKSGPLYSPDGKKIAYNWAAGSVREDIGQIQFSEAYVMNADGSHPHPLTSFTKNAPYSQDVGPAAWSPDSRRLVIARAISSVGSPAGGLGLFIVKADGTHLRQLTPWALRAGGRAEWASNGRIYFRTVPEGDAPGGDVYSIRSDGTGLRRLTDFGAQFQLGELALSPDERRLVMSKGGDSRDLFVMSVNGGRIKQITETELSENWPDWGPGGSR